MTSPAWPAKADFPLGQPGETRIGDSTVRSECLVRPILSLERTPGRVVCPTAGQNHRPFCPGKSVHLGLKKDLTFVYSMHMAKPATLNDDAYAAIQSAKLSDKESISDVILRLVPRPLQTFADLEAHLEQLDGPVIVDQAALDRLRKAKAARAD